MSSSPQHEELEVYKGCRVALVRNYLSEKDAGELFKALKETLPTGEYFFKMYGKEIRTPRRMSFFGDEGVANFDPNGQETEGIGYTYGRNTYPVFSFATSTHVLSQLTNGSENLRIYAPNPNNSVQVGPALRAIADNLDAEYGQRIDSCLINEYEGDNYISPHSDKEALGEDNAVLAISLGGTRKMVFRGKSPKRRARNSSFSSTTEISLLCRVRLRSTTLTVSLNSKNTQSFDTALLIVKSNNR